MESQHQLPSKPTENDAFWRQHHESQKASGLSRKTYSLQHDLNYDRFGYWLSKQSHHSDKLISVNLKTEISAVSQNTLCTLDLKNGHRLQIHDTRVLTIILDRYA